MCVSGQPSYGRQRAFNAQARSNSRHALHVTAQRFTLQVFLQHLNDSLHTLVIKTEWFTAHLSTAVVTYSPLYLLQLDDSLSTLLAQLEGFTPSSASYTASSKKSQSWSGSGETSKPLFTYYTWLNIRDSSSSWLTRVTSQRLTKTCICEFSFVYESHNWVHLRGTDAYQKYKQGWHNTLALQTKTLVIQIAAPGRNNLVKMETIRTITVIVQACMFVHLLLKVPFLLCGWQDIL